MNMRKTKIVCTIGPASESEAVMKEMIAGGMNVARLNFSHGSHDSHAALIARIKKVRCEMNRPVAILLDTKGPEIRLGTFKEGKISLAMEDAFLLTGREIEGDESGVSVSYPPLARSLKVGDRILIDDGKVALSVTSIDDLDIHCRVTAPGTLRDRKGVNLPYISVDMPFLSERDKSDLRFGIEQGVDFVAASFVRSAEDVKLLRDFLDQNGGSEIRIISKIENSEGVDNFEGILALSDGIMVARGDMGVEISFRRIPGIQKRIIRRTCEEGKISVTATHMLESMIEKATPTRAEITDVANAVFDGTSAVMTSGETAMGAHPALVVRTMADIAAQAEADSEEVDSYRERIVRGAHRDVAYAISDAACTIASDIGAGMMVAFTFEGTAAQDLSGFRPAAPILALTPNEKTTYRLALTWGVYPITVSQRAFFESQMAPATALAKQEGWARSGDAVVITADVPTELDRAVSLVRIAMVP